MTHTSCVTYACVTLTCVMNVFLMIHQCIVFLIFDDFVFTLLGQFLSGRFDPYSNDVGCKESVCVWVYTYAMSLPHSHPVSSEHGPSTKFVCHNGVPHTLFILL
eukprot:Blabericola_migrator_1__7638@NODE_38_length_17790_cov_195_231733_g34_i0_p16_GENE_NODE_38_length_17790_cov_195_231733_g34_i0NODE_38_length_17790_cov_195_231733_g34_i0_p16_ORF_typecomplete_len104_score12_71_NODE_38_length_17790_cov_195_231733_g34_i01184012151